MTFQQTLEKKLAPEIVNMTTAREVAIAKAKTNLVVYDDMTKTLKEELEKRRKLEMAMADTELKDYEKLLPAEAAFWERKNNPADAKTVWTFVQPKKASATKKNKVTIAKDGAIVSTDSS